MASEYGWRFSTFWSTARKEAALLISSGRVVDPSLGLDAICDVRTRDGVVEIGEHLEPLPGEEVLDARNAVVAPGFIDMHVHLRDPGDPEKETLESGGAAALRGGFTAVACMPNTRPALDRPSVLTDLLGRVEARAARLPRIYPIAAITVGREGLELCDYAALARSGAVAFSDDGCSVVDGGILEAAADAARDVRGPFISHCENLALKPLSAALSESSIVARDLRIARTTGKAWHFAHISTHMGVELLRFARASGLRVTAEATPHHLACTQESAKDLGPAAAVNPPLSDEDDVRALREAVRDGTIDVFASDHAPHTTAEKYGDPPAAGYSALEIAVGAYAAALPGLPLARFVDLLSCAAARILGVPGGTLSPGSPADLTLFDDVPWRVDARAFVSKGHVTPFDGALLPRRVVATIVGGRLLYDARVSNAL
jgi:dihydroorotase